MELFENVASRGSLGVRLFILWSQSPYMSYWCKCGFSGNPARAGPEPPALFPLCWEQHSWEAQGYLYHFGFWLPDLLPLCGPLELWSCGSCPLWTLCGFCRRPRALACSQTGPLWLGHGPASLPLLGAGLIMSGRWSLGWPCGHCPYDQAHRGLLRGWGYSPAQRHWWHPLWVAVVYPQRPPSCKAVLGNPDASPESRRQPGVSRCLLQTPRAPGCPQGERPVQDPVWSPVTLSPTSYISSVTLKSRASELLIYSWWFCVHERCKSIN